MRTQIRRIIDLCDGVVRNAIGGRGEWGGGDYGSGKMFLLDAGEG